VPRPFSGKEFDAAANVRLQHDEFIDMNSESLQSRWSQTNVLIDTANHGNIEILALERPIFQSFVLGDRCMVVPLNGLLGMR
jgi:hypothetical protein